MRGAERECLESVFGCSIPFPVLQHFRELRRRQGTAVAIQIIRRKLHQGAADDNDH